jgi:uncharacterized protein YndB with AHSA1/START domain
MTFEISVDIAAPPDTVWAVMSDAERWHEWTTSVRSIRVLNGPLQVGSRALVRQPNFPPAMWKVVALDPGHSFTWKTGMPGLWVHARHMVAPKNAGTRATLSVRFEGPLGRLVGRLTSEINNRYLALEAAGLKRRSEERAEVTPGR